MRAGGGVGEQHPHVPRAHVVAIHLEGRTGVAGDAADDVQRVGLVEGRGGEAVGVIDGERDFGEVPRRARGRAGEDHVLHAGTAHGLWAGFAHHPAQGFEKIGFAAAVGPHDPCQARRDDELRRIDETLESLKPELGE